MGYIENIESTDGVSAKTLKERPEYAYRLLTMASHFSIRSQNLQPRGRELEQMYVRLCTYNIFSMGHITHVTAQAACQCRHDENN
jgi:hypothetical protein